MILSVRDISGQKKKHQMARKLVLPDRLPDYGIELLTERHRRRLEHQGNFPKRVQITGRTHAYVEDEILALAEVRIAERDAAGEAP